MRTKAFTLSAFTGLLINATLAHAAEGKLDKWTDTLHSAGFSGVVSVRENGKSVFEHVSNGGQGSAAPIRADDVFWVGSVSKQFVAVAVLKLVSQRKIELEQPVTAYLRLAPGALTREGKTCTVEHILSNTCGLPEGSTLCPDIDLDEEPNRRRYLECIGKQKLVFTPGEQHLYANLGFGLAGVLVSEVSGKSYDAFLQTELFEPVGMKSTGTNLKSNPEAQKRLAHAELLFGSIRLPAAAWLWLDPEGPGRDGASGNIFSTAEDLHRWNTALHEGKILSPELYERFAHPRHKNYGMGIVTKKEGDYRWLWHNGGLTPMSWSSHLAYEPTSKLSVVVLANRGPGLSHMDSVGMGLVKSYLTGAAPALEPLEDKAYVFDGFFTVLPLVGYLCLAMLLFFAVRGPKKTAASWLAAFITYGSVILVVLSGLDFYRDYLWVPLAPALITVAAVLVHRTKWLDRVLNATVRREELKAAAAPLLTAGVFLYVLRGNNRFWLLGMLGALAAIVAVSIRQALRARSP